MNGQAGIAFIFGFNKVWCRLCPWGYGGIIVGQPAAAAGVGKGGKKNICPEFHLSMEKRWAEISEILKMFVQNLIKVEKYGQKCQKF